MNINGLKQIDVNAREGGAWRSINWDLILGFDLEMRRNE